MESSFQDFVLNDLNRRKDSTRRQGDNMRGSDFRSSCHLPTNLSGLDQKHYCTNVFLPMLAACCSASCYSCFFLVALEVFFPVQFCNFSLPQPRVIFTYFSYQEVDKHFFFTENIVPAFCSHGNLIQQFKGS